MVADSAVFVERRGIRDEKPPISMGRIGLRLVGKACVSQDRRIVALEMEYQKTIFVMHQIFEHLPVGIIHTAPCLPTALKMNLCVNIYLQFPCDYLTPILDFTIPRVEIRAFNILAQEIRECLLSEFFFEEVSKGRRERRDAA
jgi:hypothetical protein